MQRGAQTFRLACWLILAGAFGHGNAWADAPSSEPIRPLPNSIVLDNAKAGLGEKLFGDSRLSGDNSLSCASCHNSSKGMADGLAHSPGFHGVPTEGNTPSLFNSGYNFRQKWNGGAASLEELTEKVVENPKVMNARWDRVAEALERDAAISRDFRGLYSDGVTRTNIIDALVTYMRSLITPNARVDRYLNGDSQALSPAELRGYQLFKKYGCSACHQGMNIGGNMYQTFGVMGDYFAARGNITPFDYGRYNVTKNPEDRYVFKVPSLRNVALTAPYFHDGSAPTLEAAVDVMFRYQLGRDVELQHKRDIVQFLHSLTGEYRGKSLEQH